MTRKQIERWADLLVDYCLEVQPGETVLIVADGDAQQLVDACFRAVVLRQAHPLIRARKPRHLQFFLEHATPNQLGYVSPVDLFEAQQVDARIRIDAATNTRSLGRIDPERQAVWDRTQDVIRREARQKRYVLTQYPTAAFAADARMPQDEYQGFVAGAMFLDRDDPVAAWREQRDRQARLIRALAGAGTIRVEAEGTDLTLSVAGRTWINSDGRRNMPSGEIFTSPVEVSAEGRLRCGFPVVDAGREVTGINLRFRGGRVVEAQAAQGEDYLRAMLDLDPGARVVGELGIGLNPRVDRFTGSILFDEKINGTIHVAVGDGYPEAGGQNTSALHWDLIVDTRTGGRVTVDGRVMMQNGVWRID